MEFTQIGRFEIREKLGRGAMGEVFRGHDPDLGRDAAIKIVSAGFGEDEAARKNLRREAQAAAKLNHPNIVTIYEVGEHQGMAYMAMELLEGDDLREVLRKGGLTSLDEKLATMEQILEGLAFAHSKGVVHRDLKPGNVRVLPQGRVKIMDFGLARPENAAATGTLMGTPHYMAPEQLQGAGATARSDVFSVGAMFYEILSGRLPFPGQTIAVVLYGVVHRDPEPLAQVAPEVPPGVAAVVMHALTKAPGARYANAGEMLQALRAARAGAEMPLRAEAGATADLGAVLSLGPTLSARADTSPEMHAALLEIWDYLDDRIPPLMVADAVATFTGAPVDGAAAEIEAWAERQQALQPVLPLADVLFHAIHKLSVIGELELVDAPKLLAFLGAVGALLAEACPPGEGRDRFRRGLAHLGEAEMVRSGPFELQHASGPIRAEPALVPAATSGLRRLSFLEQRLLREVPQGTAARIARRRVASQAIAAAATEARSEGELQDHLRRLRAAGVESGAQQVFRALGQELADWAVPKNIVPDTVELGPPNEVRAMKQLVSLPEDPVEVARRYRHLVSAATEQFNEGNLGRAMQMFELATKLAGEKKVEAGFMQPVLKKGHETLDDRMLRQYMDRPDRHEQLRAVMAFFDTGLGPAALLDELETEDRRDRRRLLLDLLAVHGETARALARARLEASLERPASDFSRRNWIYLLRLVPRPAGEKAEGEIDAVARLARPGGPAFLVKEALTYLGQARHPHVPDVLVSLLGAWETELERDDLDGTAREEGLGTLDRVASALARQGGPRGWRALVDHGLSERPELGETVRRLTELGGQDLSPAPDVVETLVSEVRASLPRGVLGRLVGRKDQELPSLVSALAGTRTPAVRALLEEVQKRHHGQEAGRVAGRALAAPPPSAGAAAVGGHSGELDPYGLPALLHRLAEGKATGTLSLLPKESGGAPATVGFSRGRLVAARWGPREGVAALYQLFERPFPGRYAFDAGAPPAAGGEPLSDLAGLVREGVQRARELQRASAVVPEDLPLEATGTAPGTVVDEPDYNLIVALWEKACARVPVRQMEAELAADAFRIHRPLAQWLEEGALRIVTPGATEAPTGAPSSPDPGT
jgi:hypothetical protein